LSSSEPAQLAIDGAAALEAQTSTLMRAVHGWKHLTGLQMEVTTGVRPTEMAYANQILCRTVDKDVSVLEGRDAATLRAIYETCFERRIKPLLEILRPSVVVVIGKKATPKSSWPEWFKAACRKHGVAQGTDVVDITYPSFHNNAAFGMSNAQLARQQLRERFPGW